MQIKITVTSQQSEWPSPKVLQSINTTESVEKREPSYTGPENFNWCGHYGKHQRLSFKNRVTI